MDILNLLKSLLGINMIDTSQDDTFNFYITKAKNVIKKYSLLTDEELISANLTNQIVELAMFYYNNRKYVGAKNASEGSKSRSFESESIPTSIKSTLPKPPIFSA